jgi:hypothetical protein
MKKFFILSENSDRECRECNPLETWIKETEVSYWSNEYFVGVNIKEIINQLIKAQRKNLFEIHFFDSLYEAKEALKIISLYDEPRESYKYHIVGCEVIILPIVVSELHENYTLFSV